MSIIITALQFSTCTQFLLPLVPLLKTVYSYRYRTHMYIHVYGHVHVCTNNIKVLFADSLTSELSFVIFEEALLEFVPGHFFFLREVAVPEGVDGEFLTVHISNRGLSTQLCVETTAATDDGLRVINSYFSWSRGHLL